MAASSFPGLFVLPTLLSAALLLAGPAHAGKAQVTGYVRAGARPDFQGAGATLGYWNLYGRLLNEGPYAMI